MTMVGITIVSPSTTTFDAQSTTDPLIPRIWRNSPWIAPHGVKMTIGLPRSDRKGILEPWGQECIIKMGLWKFEFDRLNWGHDLALPG